MCGFLRLRGMLLLLTAIASTLSFNSAPLAIRRTHATHCAAGEQGIAATFVSKHDDTAHLQRADQLKRRVRSRASRAPPVCFSSATPESQPHEEPHAPTSGGHAEHITAMFHPVDSALATADGRVPCALLVVHSSSLHSSAEQACVSGQSVAIKSLVPDLLARGFAVALARSGQTGDGGRGGDSGDGHGEGAGGAGGSAGNGEGIRGSLGSRGGGVIQVDGIADGRAVERGTDGGCIGRSDVSSSGDDTRDANNESFDLVGCLGALATEPTIDLKRVVLLEFSAVGQLAIRSSQPEHGVSSIVNGTREVVEMSDLSADRVLLSTSAERCRVGRKMTRSLQEAGWQMPPHAADYGVSEARGFLPARDPLRSLMIDVSDDESHFAVHNKIAGLGAGVGEHEVTRAGDAGVAGESSSSARGTDSSKAASALALSEARVVCATWESCAAELPSLLAAGAVRERLRTLPLPPATSSPPSSPSSLSSPPSPWLRWLARDERRLERAYTLLSFLAHAYVWGEVPVVTRLPSCLSLPWTAVAAALSRRPVLTYASFNLHNWRRIDPTRPIELGNTCRLCNFLGGQDEEWFSAVHVSIEAAAGSALAAAAAAQTSALRMRTVTHAVGGGGGDGGGGGAGGTADNVSSAEAFKFDGCDGVVAKMRTQLETVASSVEAMAALLRRMDERCDPYIYHSRVRLFMSGWTHEAFGDRGLEYEGVLQPSQSSSARPPPPPSPAARPPSPSSAPPQWRHERYFGETGAQSSAVPALDAALGIEMSSDDLLPYLLAMRDYMPNEHAEYVRALERGPSVREAVVDSGDVTLQAAYDSCVRALLKFRKLHFELAFRYVRQWDSRPDLEISGTGGTPFMPYLRKHRRTTHESLLNPQRRE